MQVWKLLLAAKGLLWGVRKLRERKHFRRGIIAGAAIALAAPLAIHAPAEAAQILVKEGMRGGAVQHVQELLIKAGYLEEGGADGVAGAKTRAAIERCQTDHMLVVDGICGEATYLVLSGGGRRRRDSRQPHRRCVRHARRSHFLWMAGTGNFYHGVDANRYETHC